MLFYSSRDADSVELIKDFWRCGVVDAPLAQIVARGSLEGLPITWLPGTSGLRYIADPFGLWREDRLHVFAEQFDYRDGVGRIVAIILDRDLRVIDERLALREPWHLSYPYVFEAEGETWMLPEAHASGALHLYRARDFPFGWERAATIALPHMPLDATPVRHDGRWWMFYAPAQPTSARLTTLCAAHAPSLTGEWTSLPDPILVDPRGARPGGTPVMVDEHLHLPLQRCVGSYGTGIRLLRLNALSPDRVAATVTSELDPPADAAPYRAGLHTLSAVGDVTLIDVKRRRFSPAALAAWPARLLRRRAQLA